MIKLKDILAETKSLPAIFRYASADPNRNGDAMDQQDLISREEAKKAVIHALSERLAQMQEDDMDGDDMSATVEETMELNEEFNDEVDDHEGSMAKADLLAIHKQAGELYNMMGENEELEGWVQSKITKAADYINAVYNNMQYEKSKPQAVGNGMGAPADTTDRNIHESVNESAPKGWEATVKKMKKHKEIDNPWALAYWMKAKGYKPKKKGK